MLSLFSGRSSFIGQLTRFCLSPVKFPPIIEKRFIKLRLGTGSENLTERKFCQHRPPIFQGQLKQQGRHSVDDVDSFKTRRNRSVSSRATTVYVWNPPSSKDLESLPRRDHTHYHSGHIKGGPSLSRRTSRLFCWYYELSLVNRRRFDSSFTSQDLQFICPQVFSKLLVFSISIVGIRRAKGSFDDCVSRKVLFMRSSMFNF